MNGFFAKIKDSFGNFLNFTKDTRKELNNVSWPTRRELTGTTIVVIVAVFFFGFFLWIVDLIVGPAMGFLLRTLSS